MEKLTRQIRREVEDVAESLIDWAMALNNAEKLLLFCGFILFMFVAVIRGSDVKKRSRNEIIQFGFAMTLVAAAGYGVGWSMDV